MKAAVLGHPEIRAGETSPERSAFADAAAPALPTAVEKGVILFFVAFLLVFPKGGIKLAGVPITWGYLGMALFSLWLPLALLSRRTGEIDKARLLTLALLVPFQAIAWLGLLANGVGDLGFTLSFVVTFFFIPLMFVLVFGMHLDRIDLGFLLRLVRLGVLATAVYGIVLFAYKLITGDFFQIPYLTVNAGDVGGLEGKFIDRGGIFKLISTYNNGNIYGICMLMLLPLYTWLERSTAKQLVVKGALLLTLSRTVWAGLILFEVLQRLYIRPVSLRTLAVLSTSLVLIVLGVWYALELMGLEVAFLFDRTLGGRQEQWRDLASTTVLPGAEFDGIREMVYLSVLHFFGVVGLAAFLLAMAAPLLLHLLGALPFASSGYKRSLAAGLFIYLFLSISDGALLFIPVMAIYWFVVSLLLSGNPSFPRDPAAGGAGSGGAEVERDAPRVGPQIVALNLRPSRRLRFRKVHN